jgi:hypothetical protein
LEYSLTPQFFFGGFGCHIDPLDSSDGPAGFLWGFSGYLQADAYTGYDGIYAGGKVIEVPC